MILRPLTNKYGKISTIIVFYAPIFFPGEEHRSRSQVELVAHAYGHTVAEPADMQSLSSVMSKDMPSTSGQSCLVLQLTAIQSVYTVIDHKKTQLVARKKRKKSWSK
jgi:hypothetical protein